MPQEGLYLSACLFANLLSKVLNDEGKRCGRVVKRCASTKVKREKEQETTRRKSENRR